jgi:ABC-2 type transport system permease protein
LTAGASPIVRVRTPRAGDLANALSGSDVRVETVSPDLREHHRGREPRRRLLPPDRRGERAGGIPMTRLVRTEWLKLRTMFLPYGLLVASAGLTALITALIASRAGQNVGPVGMHLGTGEGLLPPLSTAEGLSRVITATRFGLLFATVLGVIVSGGEFRHGTATATYLATPQRGRVLFAKILAAAAVGLLFGAVAAGAATGIGLAFVWTKGFAVALSVPTMLRFAAGTALAAALLAAIGVAVGALIRQEVAGIVGIFAWGLVAEGILGANFPSISRYLPYTAANAMSAPASSGISTLPFGAAAALLAGAAVLIAAITTRTTLQADIT